MGNTFSEEEEEEEEEEEDDDEDDDDEGPTVCSIVPPTRKIPNVKNGQKKKINP